MVEPRYGECELRIEEVGGVSYEWVSMKVGSHVSIL